jgi:hypothetical protein
LERKIFEICDEQNEKSHNVRKRIDGVSFVKYIFSVLFFKIK